MDAEATDLALTNLSRKYCNLEAEVERLKEALEYILQHGRPEGCGDGGWPCRFAQHAEDALNGHR